MRATPTPGAVVQQSVASPMQGKFSGRSQAAHERVGLDGFEITVDDTHRTAGIRIDAQGRASLLQHQHEVQFQHPRQHVLQPSRGRLSRIPEVAPVSYTHLTLPTNREV